MSMNIESLANNAAIKFAKHKALSILIGTIPDPQIQAASPSAIDQITGTMSTWTGMVSAAVSNATRMAKDIGRQAMALGSKNAFMADGPSVVTGMCSFISTIGSGDFITQCLDQGMMSLDMLVNNPNDLVYVPVGFTTVKDIQELVTTPAAISSSQRAALINYQNGVKAGMESLQTCGESGIGFISDYASSIDEMSALQAAVGELLGNLVQMLSVGTDFISAFQNCFAQADSVIPGISDSSGFNQARDMLNAVQSGSYTIEQAMSNAKDQAIAMTGFADKAASIVSKWV